MPFGVTFRLWIVRWKGRAGSRSLILLIELSSDDGSPLLDTSRTLLPDRTLLAP